MPKQFVDRDRGGEVEKSMPDVVVEYLGEYPLTWVCQNYSGDGRDLILTFIPGQKETLQYNYARTIFGDWELDPGESHAKKVAWRNMIANRSQRSPSKDGMLPKARIYTEEGELLWDTLKQYANYKIEAGISPESNPAYASAAKQFGEIPIPASLEKMNGDELKAKWLQMFGFKMPASISYENAKKVMMPHLKPADLKTELQEQASIPVSLPPTHVRHEDPRIKIEGGMPAGVTAEE